MPELSRRRFLGGVAACALAPALPVPVAPPPIFAGRVGVYHGVIFREVDRLSPDMLAAAKRLALTCGPGVRPWGDEYAYPLHGIEVDDER